MKTIEARIGTQSPLLILGDNPILDTWKWLELDRAAPSVAAAGRPLVARQFLASFHGISIAFDATFYRMEHFFGGYLPGGRSMKTVRMNCKWQLAWDWLVLRVWRAFGWLVGRGLWPIRLASHGEPAGKSPG